MPTETGRNHAVSFVINNKAYIGTGYAEYEYFYDFWEFDPQTNAWVRKADYGGGYSYGANAFTIGTLGYVSSSKDILPYYGNEFWSYNRSSNTWTRKADIPGGDRYFPFGFAIGSNGYVGGGISERPYNPDPYSFYRYTTSTTGSTQN